MAEFKFHLRQSKQEIDTPIFLRGHYSGIEVKCKTGVKCLPSEWDRATGSPKNTKATKPIRARLDVLKVCAGRAFDSFKDRIPTASEFQEAFYELAGLEKPRPIVKKPKRETLITFIERVITESEGRLNVKTGKSISANTIGVYKQTLNLLKDFDRSGKRIDFKAIDLDFFHDFKQFMEARNYSQNTMAKHIKTLKTFLNEATERGISDNFKHKSKRFQIPFVSADTIYLDTTELDELFKLDLSKTPKLERVRDLFLIGCHTGLRFSDFTNIRPENIEADFITIETKKTAETVVIPMHPNVRAIMARYKGRTANSLPRSISNQKMNEYLKEIAQKVSALNERSTITRSKGRMQLKQHVHKFERITTHTARRSFATNLYKEGFPSHGIMKITGHRTEKAFLKYIKVTPKENAQILKLHWERMANIKGA